MTERIRWQAVLWLLGFEVAIAACSSPAAPRCSPSYDHPGSRVVYVSAACDTSVAFIQPTRP